MGMGGTARLGRLTAATMAAVAALAAVAVALSAWLATERPTAATLGGRRIGEDEVTARVESTRRGLGLESDADWAAWVGSAGGVGAVRERAIRDIAREEAVRSLAAREGVEVTDGDVDAAVSAAMAASGLSGEAWDAALAASGTDAAAFREATRARLVERGLLGRLTTMADGRLGSRDVLAAARAAAAALRDARRVACIVVPASDADAVRAVADGLRDGGPTAFDALRERYGTSDAFDGWPVGGETAAAVQGAVAGLAPGEVAGPVEVGGSVAFARVEEAVEAADGVESLDDLPPSLVDAVEAALAEPGRHERLSREIDAEVARLGLAVRPADASSLPYNVDVDAAGDASGGV